jgi:hypothetical protein
VTQSASDCAQLLPMTDAVEANLGRKPEQASADAGYCSEENLAGLEARSIDGYVATGRARDAVAGTGKDEAARAPSSTQPAKTPTRVEGMRAKIKAGGHASPYRLRKQPLQTALHADLGVLDQPCRTPVCRDHAPAHSSRRIQQREGT